MISKKTESSFSIKPRLKIKNNFTTNPFDGIKVKSRSLIYKSFVPNFVLVGNSYTKIDSYSDNFIGDLSDLSNILFEDFNTYFTFVLGKSRVIYICIHSFAISYIKSPIVSILALVYESLNYFTEQANPLIISLKNTILDLLQILINEYRESIIFFSDEILPEIIDVLLKILKTFRKLIHASSKLCVSPILGLLLLSLIASPLNASASNISSTIEIKNEIKETAFATTPNYNKFDGLDNTISKTDFTLLKTNLINDLNPDRLLTSQQLYYSKNGDTIDSISLNSGVEKNKLTLSNFHINFEDILVDLNDKPVYLSKENIWIKNKKTLSISSLAKLINSDENTLRNLQINSVLNNYSTNSNIQIPFGDQKTALANLSILKQEKIIFDDFNIIERETSIFNAQEAQRLIDEQKKQELLNAELLANQNISKETVTSNEEKPVQNTEPAKKPVDSNTKSQAIAGSNLTVWPATGTMSRCNLSYHLACDIANRVGTAIVAFRSGRVIEAGWKTGGYGNMVLIDHGNGLESIYMHLSSVSVKVGQNVVAGEFIGSMGSTGNSTGSHLHFGIFENGREVTPYKFLTWR
jgi:murein DD-endopeptidase MepM/ murein hydrolase activator NlpD